MLQQLAARWGPAVSDPDVRLYIKQRARNARRGHKRGNFPEDDQLPQPGTYAKLAPAVQDAISEQRPPLPRLHDAWVGGGLCVRTRQ